MQRPRWLGGGSSSEPVVPMESEPTSTERRIAVVADLGEKLIAPWKKAVDVRDRIIERLKEQRNSYRDRLGEYVTALKGRDEIIVKLRGERDDLKAKLDAIENGEKPEDPPEVSDHELPPSPDDAPGAEEETVTPEA